MINHFSKLTSAKTAEEIYEDFCGRRGIGETPECVARGGLPAARGKRSIFLERLLRTIHLL
ncbi:hypothetical protein CIT14_16895 [Virgibacillus profundi]|nr:hypothetical protein CIT14_16895 [Virgibacillus profundi]